MSTMSTRVTWTRVCAVADLPSGEATTLDIDPPIAVFSADGSFYAIDDTCTHETYSLADGYIEGAQVECALHFAQVRSANRRCAVLAGATRCSDLSSEDGGRPHLRGRRPPGLS